MDRKKSWYLLGVGVVVVLGYLNYFRDETVPGEKETVIETKDAKYSSEDYKIDAEKQQDFLEKKESIFQKAKATLKDTLLSGDSVILDSARNLILKSNILGKTANGWSFSGEDLKYEKSTDEILSDTGISASNQELGIKIKGDSFRSDSKMNKVSLKGNVVLDNDKLEIRGENANYSNSDKKLELSGEVKLLGKNYPEKLEGEFGTLVYDGEKKLLIADEKFNITYGNALFTGNYFQYNQEKDTLLVEQDLVISGGDYTVTLDKIEKESNSDILNLKGKIVGTGKEYNFSGDWGTYNLKTNELEVYGDVTVVGKDGELKTTYLNYDTKKEILTMDRGFQFKDKNYSGKGEKLVYNSGANDALLKNVEIDSKDRKLTTQELDYNGTLGKVFFPSEFKIRNKESTELFISKNAVYDIEKNLFTTEESFQYIAGEKIATGVGIVYNSETGAGEIKKEIRIEDRSAGSLITGDRVELLNKEFGQLLGNIQFSGKGYKTSAEKAVYSFLKNSLEIPQKIEINSEENDTVILMDNPIVDLEKNEFTGSDFQGKGMEYSASSKKAIYNYKTSLLTLKDSGVIETKGNVLKGDHLKYNSKTEIMEAVGAYEINYENLVEKGENIYLNNLTGEIKGGKVEIVTDKNESFQGDKISGNLQEGVINISGKVLGKVYEKGTPVDFAGNLVKLYLKKEGSAYKIEKVEIRDNSTIKNKDTTLYSKNIDIDLVKNIAVAYPDPKALLKDLKNGDTEVTAKTGVFNMNEDKIYLKESVTFENRNPEKGVTTGLAGLGVIDTLSKTIELTEKPVIDSPEAKIRADKIIYNSVTRKINATGEVVVDYKEKQ